MLSQETALALPSASESQDDERARDSSPVFEALYVAQRDSVFRYLRSRTGNDDQALELAAITFERAWRYQAGHPSVDLGIGWLLRTARNAAVDASRRRKAADLLAWITPWRERTVPSPEAELLRDEQAAEVRRAVAGLPAAQRDAIALRYASCLTVREIADVLGRSEAATQKQLSRGLARLREVLDDWH